MKKNYLVISGLSALLFVIGCGIPKDKYNVQVVRANKMQARAENAETSLKDTNQKLVKVESNTNEIKKVLDNQQTIIKGLRSSMKGLLQAERKVISKKINDSKTTISGVVKKDVKRKCKVSFSNITLKVLMATDGKNFVNKVSLGKNLNTKIKPLLEKMASCFQKGKVKKKVPFMSNFGFSFTVNKKGRVKKVSLSHKIKMAKRAKKCVFKSIKKLKLGKLEKPIYAYYTVKLKVIQKNKPNCQKTKKTKKSRKSRKSRKTKKSKKSKKSKK
jgi:hypothetical protein